MVNFSRHVSLLGGKKKSLVIKLRPPLRDQVGPDVGRELENNPPPAPPAFRLRFGKTPAFSCHGFSSHLLSFCGLTAAHGAAEL